MIFQQLKDRLKSLQQLIQQLPEETYRQPSAMLGGASIGKHVRHVLEVFQCLHDGYAEGVVNYELRQRDVKLENHPSIAISLIGKLLRNIPLEDKHVTVSFAGDRGTVSSSSSFVREINYNIEHAVHHFAMIHVVLREMNLQFVGEEFGKANSTIQYEAHQEQLARHPRRTYQ